MELQDAFERVKGKLTVNPGEYVCLTKISGMNNMDIKPGEVFVGKLKREISIGLSIDLSSSFGIITRPVIACVISFSSMLIMTENSVYLLEKV